MYRKLQTAEQEITCLCFIGNWCTGNIDHRLNKEMINNVAIILFYRKPMYEKLPTRTTGNVKLVRQWEGHYGAKNLIASLTFQNRTIFNENLMAIELSKKELIFNKPMYIGMAIFDIAKNCVYDFHYSYIIMSPTRPPS
jgi:hypothetical protein